MKVKNLDIASLSAALNNEKPTVVKFMNPSCHLCTGLAPVFEIIAKEFFYEFEFANFNVKQFPKVAKVFKIEGVPDLFVVKKNYVKQVPYPSEEFVDSVSGYSKKYIVDYLNQIMLELNNIQD